MEERASNEESINYTPFFFKRAISTIAYLFKNGPWKNSYVRFGYDPKKFPESFRYQNFNVGIQNPNYLNQQKKLQSTDYKKRLFKIFQVGEVKDLKIQSMLEFVEKQLEISPHKEVDFKYGWMNKNQYFCFSKRLKEIFLRSFDSN